MIDDGKRPVRTTPEPAKGREHLSVHQRDNAIRLIMRLAAVDAQALRAKPKGPEWMELVELITDASYFLADLACGFGLGDDRRPGEDHGIA
jgi:hypothetical protein